MKNSFDIEKMSQETGISALIIKKSLNIPLDGDCRASTTKEAKEIYDNLPCPCPEETKAVVLRRWNELFLLEAKKAVSDKEIKGVFKCIPPDLEDKSFVLGRWNKLSLLGIKGVNTIGKAEEVYENLPCPCLEKTKVFLLRKWNELFLLDLEKATVTKEVKDLYYHLPPESLGTRKATWEKWIKLSGTSQEIKEVEISIRNYYHDPDDFCDPDGKINNILLQKKVEIATTIKELEDFYFWVFSVGKVTLSTQKIFWNKWMLISTTAEEVLSLYNRKHIDPESNNLAMEKIASFYGWKK